MSKTIQTKRCSYCKQIKQLSEFHKNQSQKDGLQYQCKPCKNFLDSNYQKTEKGKATRLKAVKKYQKTPKGKANLRSYRQSKEGKAAQQRANNNLKVRHPNYVKAHNAVSNAIRIGDLPRPDTLQCHYCPKPAQQYHHHKGYKPVHWLNVVPACNSCHVKERKKTA